MSKRDRDRKRKREIEEAEFNKLDQAPCRFPSNPDKMSLVRPGLCSGVKVSLLPANVLTHSSSGPGGRGEKNSLLRKGQLETTPADMTS